jgi:hypothetical protein
LQGAGVKEVIENIISHRSKQAWLPKITFELLRKLAQFLVYAVRIGR